MEVSSLMILDYNLCILIQNMHNNMLTLNNCIVVPRLFVHCMKREPARDYMLQSSPGRLFIHCVERACMLQAVHSLGGESLHVTGCSFIAWREPACYRLLVHCVPLGLHVTIVPRLLIHCMEKATLHVTRLIA